MMEQKHKRLEFISFARVVSALAVVYIHTNECYRHLDVTTGLWKTANFMECLFYFGVPVFFMISGATLMDFYDRYDLKSYLGKRFRKTVIPYVFWSLAGILIQIGLIGNLKPASVNLKYIVEGLLRGKLVVSVYWFFIPLFAIYLTLPVFAAVPRKMRRTVFGFTAGTCFLFNMLLPFLKKMLAIDINYSFTLGLGTNCMLFAVMGYLLAHEELKTREKWALYIAGLAGFLMMLFGTEIYSAAAGELDDSWKGYTNLPGFLYGTAMFVVLRFSGEKLMKHPRVSRAVHFLEKYTFGIYLLHWFVLQIIVRTFSIQVSSLWHRLLTPIPVTAVCIAAVWLLRKIPVLRETVP